VAGVDWLGRLSLLGGAESETWRRKSDTGGSAHGFVLAEGLGVIPLTSQIGLQLSGDFQVSFDGGKKFGAQIGPIFDFGMGKAGLFLTNQFRAYFNSDSERQRQFYLLWLTPAVAFYDVIPNTNIDIWWSNQLSRHVTLNGSENDPRRQYSPTSSLRAAINFFPGGMPFGNGNTELTLGVQVNGLSGADKHWAWSGAGPVVGVAVMPWQNVELQVVKFTMDNRNRYRVTTGLQLYFDKTNPTLIQLRRKYLEPTNLPNIVGTHWNRS
jgi:hypothetical protein